MSFDEPIKAFINLIIYTLCLFLLITIVTFGIVTNRAKATLYATIDYIEINGFDDAVISQYARERNVNIQVTSTPDEGIYSNGGKNRYFVEVTYEHLLAWLNYKPTITLKGVTRAVEY